MRQALREAAPVLRAVQPESFWSEAINMTPLHILSVPFFKQREMVGVLVALGQAPLDEEYLPLMQHIAATVGVAVDNAQLFEDLEAFAEELERSQNQLIQVEKMAAVGRLAASLAHEINNPLQAIQNSLHLALHKGLEGDRRRQYLEMVQQEVGRLVQIVRRMLDFYRPASAMKALSINRPVENALAIANKRLEQSQVEVMVRLEENLPSVRGVENQLVQVFLNLILNAMEAMPEGGSLWVATAHHAEREQVVVAFRDSGPGIPPEIREHLFEPFHTSKSSGTGLGLAISYGIVERHGGVIDVESPPEGGTTFIVRIPQQKEEA
jgi:two-component system NtrC family sensor kinase